MEISDEEGSSLFASPTHPPTSRAHPPSQAQQQQQQQQKTPVASSAAAAAAAAASTSKNPSTNQSSGSRSFGIDNTTIETREAALQRELEGVRKINQVIEGVIGTLERAKGNMGVCLFVSLFPLFTVIGPQVLGSITHSQPQLHLFLFHPANL